MRRMIIFLMLIALLICLISCGNDTVKPANASSFGGAESSGIAVLKDESLTSPSMGDSLHSSSLSIDIPSKSSSQESQSRKPPAPSAGNDNIEARLVNYHPGLPGFDAEYNFIVKNNGMIINAKDIQITANNPNVRISNGKVIVPEAVRNTGKDVVVTVKKGSSSSVVTIPSKKWKNTFDDNFDGSDLDPSKWSVFEPYLTYSENPVSYAGMDCYEVSNGTLKLLVKKQRTTLNGKVFEYTDSAISTENKFSQTLGCYVSSMKFTPYSGVCGGSWLLPVQGGGGRQSVFFHSDQPTLGCGEVDIIEATSIWNKRYSITEHFWDIKTGAHTRTNHSMASPSANIFDGKFHAIGVAITEDASYYYCDGELMATFSHFYKCETTKDGVLIKKSPVRNFMLFSFRLGKDDETNWVGRWNFSDKDFPLTYEIDWCRAYI